MAAVSQPICRTCNLRPADVVISKCSHQPVMCSPCYFVHHYKDKMQKCVECGNELTRTSSTSFKCDDEHLALYVDYFVPPNVASKHLFGTLRTILRTIPSTCIYKVLSLLKENYAVFNQDVIPTVLLSKEQTETLITLFELFGVDQKHTVDFYNVFVSMCKTPWSVSNGRHGVCYHGNFGDKPSFDKLHSILYSNHRYLSMCDIAKLRTSVPLHNLHGLLLLLNA